MDRDNIASRGEIDPDFFIPIEKFYMDCPACKRPIYFAKMPSFMGSTYYKDILNLRDKQLSEAYKRIRELEGS